MKLRDDFLLTLKKFYGLLAKRQKISFFIILLLMLISAALTQVTPLAVGYLTDTVLANNNLHFIAVIPILCFILFVTIINEGIKVCRRLIVEDTSTRVEKAARVAAIKALLMAPLSYFRINMRGNIHGRLNRSLEGTTRMIKLLFMDFAPSIFNSIAAIIVIFSQLPVILALAMMLVIPIGILIVLRQISTQKGIRVELLETKASMDGTIVELIGGVEVIRVSDNVSAECNRFDHQSETLRQKEMRHHKAMAGYDCLKFINEALFSVLIIGISVFMASHGLITIGSILTTYLCFAQLLTPLNELHRILDQLSESTVLAAEYFKILEIPADFSYSTAKALPSPKTTNALIDIRHLNFCYSESPEKYVLQDLNLSIHSGELIGIAGPSGCGKSSFIKTLSRLEAIQGEIIFDGRPLDTYTRQELSQLITLVPQSPFLIAGSIYENIIYGLDTRPSLEAVQKAAKAAYMDHVIRTLPGGYDFMVSEAGSNLSGGQRQRLALARIFLRPSKLLILDEATSALDNTSEKHIQTAIETMHHQGDATVITIAHRLTTLENCDRILVFDKGHIVQEGTYAALTQTDGIFRDMSLGILK